MTKLHVTSLSEPRDLFGCNLQSASLPYNVYILHMCRYCLTLAATCGWYVTHEWLEETCSLRDNQGDSLDSMWALHMSMLQVFQTDQMSEQNSTAS